MLDAQKRISFAEFPDVLIFRDDTSESTFYVASAKPRLAREGDQDPQVSLLLYGKKSAGAFTPTGGLLNATVSLALTDAEQKRLEDLLRKQVIAKGGAAPQIVGLPWSEGSAELRLTPKVAASQAPSMIGDNRCAFSLRLSADQAKELEEEWRRGLPNSRVVYRVRLQPGPSTSRTQFASSQSSSLDDVSAASGESFSYTQTSTASTPLALELEGPVDLNSQDAQRLLKTVEM